MSFAWKRTFRSFPALSLCLCMLRMYPPPSGSCQYVPVRPPRPPVGPVKPPSPPKPPFLIRSYDGIKKCLDYRTASGGPGTASRRVQNGISLTPGPNAPVPRAGPSVFLNDCELAHPVVVEETQNGSHDFILHAGDQVIGVKRSPVITSGSGSTVASLPASYALELLNPRLSITTTVDDVFAFDGDSIILESSRPCISTDASLCAPPPPQLVVQVENARGINGTPLVVGPRTLADSEFWDFVASDDSSAYPTSGFVNVTTADGLWNALCASPVASSAGPPRNPDGTPATCMNFNPSRGLVLEISTPNRCDSVPGANSGDTQDIGYCIDLNQYAPLLLQAGVTLRGNRRATNLGPQLYAALYARNESRVSGQISTAIPDCPFCMLQIHGDYVRITGLRLRGKSRSLYHNDSYAANAIDIDSPVSSQSNTASTTEYIGTVDHNDISDWEGAAVNVSGGRLEPHPTNCTGIFNDQSTQDNALIERNFIHHNQESGLGYGSLLSNGGRSVIKGNTFLDNRHAISADSEAHEQYRAWYNLVLSSVPRYTWDESGSIADTGPQQDFDMHGEFKGYGGIGGNLVDIAGNTFLGPDRWNFELRGVPCVLTDYFRDNVTRQQRSDIINLHKIGVFVDVVQQGPEVPTTPVALPPPAIAYASNIYQTPTVLASQNQYRDSSPGFSDPTATLQVGDFDGDGLQDLFLSTGAAWFYSPSGVADWRFLGAKTEKSDVLLLGDLDGDGRTDVVTKRGDSLVVSWGGVSDWEVLNSNPVSAGIADLAVGNFVDDFAGDHRDDIFWADGTTWRVSSGGSGPFQIAQTSHFRVKDLRFGDFDGDGHTDVFSVQNTGWQVSYAQTQLPMSQWMPLPVSLTKSVTGLIVADFEGEGRAAIGMFSDAKVSASTSDSALDLISVNWMYWRNGLHSWESHQITPTAQCGFKSEFLLSGPLPPGFNSGHQFVLDPTPDIAAAVGHFSANPGVASPHQRTDLLLWDGYGYLFRGTNNLCLVPGGTGAAQRWSRQDMR